MKKDNSNDIEFPIYDSGSGDNNSDGLENDDQVRDGFELPDCPLTDLFISSIAMSKPFGIIWSSENMESFLKERGYRIIKKKSDTLDMEYGIAVKPDSFIPDIDYSNIREVFDEEVQKIILKWLSKIDSK